MRTGAHARRAFVGALVDDAARRASQLQRPEQRAQAAGARPTSTSPRRSPRCCSTATPTCASRPRSRSASSTTPRRSPALLAGARRSGRERAVPRHRVARPAARRRRGRAAAAIVESRDFFLAFRGDRRARRGSTTAASRRAWCRCCADELLRGADRRRARRARRRRRRRAAGAHAQRRGGRRRRVAAALASIHRPLGASSTAPARRSQIWSARPSPRRRSQHLLEALRSGDADRLRGVVTVLGWLDSPEVRSRADPAARRRRRARRRWSRRWRGMAARRAAADRAARRRRSRHAARGDRPRSAGSATAAPRRALVGGCSTTTTRGRWSPRRARSPGIGDPARVRAAAAAGRASRSPPCGRRRSARSTRSATRDMPQRIAAMLGDADPRTRESAVRIAGYFGYRETARPAARARAATRTSRSAAAAIEHLPYLDDPRVRRCSSTALQARRRALGRAPPRGAGAARRRRTAAAALRRALDDPDSWVRYSRGAALGERRDAARAAAARPPRATGPRHAGAHRGRRGGRRDRRRGCGRRC